MTPNDIELLAKLRALDPNHPMFIQQLWVTKWFCFYQLIKVYQTINGIDYYYRYLPYQRNGTYIPCINELYKMIASDQLKLLNSHAVHQL